MKELERLGLYRDETTGWTFQGSNPGGVRDFSLLQNVQTDSGTHPASNSIDTGVLSRG
jgi:hypothetical protein